MAIKKLEEIYLYTSDVATNASENIQARAFMDHAAIPYTNLMYNSEEQSTEVINTINTWWTVNPTNALPPITKYPFLIYTEVHDDIPARFSPLKYLEGLENIQTFPEIYNSIMNSN